MKKIILVRHGVDEGGHNDHITIDGRRRITDLAVKLAPHVNGCSVLMLSSTALRAIDSAEILAKQLNLFFEPKDLLWSGGGGKVYGDVDDFEKLIELISAHSIQADVVVLVTHYEYIEEFPPYFGYKYLCGVRFACKAIPMGTAWLIDCEQKKMKHIH